MRPETNDTINFFLLTPLLAALILSACARDGGEKEAAGTAALVFKHGKIAGDPAAFRALLDRFERENPGITVIDEALPSSTDEQHQFYDVNLGGKSSDFDVFSLDVIWVPEFARAGWLRDLGPLLASGEAEAFFPGPIAAVTFSGRKYAIPWYIDAFKRGSHPCIDDHGSLLPADQPLLSITCRFITSFLSA